MRFEYRSELSKKIDNLENIESKIKIKEEINQCSNVLTKLINEIKKSELPQQEIDDLLHTLEGKVNKYGLVW